MLIVFFYKVNWMTSTLVSWKSQDCVPEPIVAVLIADMDTFPKLPSSLVNGLQGFTYTVV